MRWTPYIIPAVVATASVSALTWTSIQNGRATFDEIQPVEIDYNLAANENNWYNQSPTAHINLFNGSPQVSYAIVPDGKSPSASDYLTVNASTAGYTTQYRYRYMTQETVYSTESPGDGWVKTGNTKQETYWAPVRTETDISISELPAGIDRFYSIDANGNHTKLTWKRDEFPDVNLSDTSVYRYEVDGFYHTAPAYYANGQPVPILWQGKYTKSTTSTNIFLDSYIKVNWNTNPNQTLYKYDQIWEAIPIDGYYPILMGNELNAHIESFQNRDDDWFKNFSALAAKNQNVKIVGVDFKKITYQRAQRTTYEWKRVTDSGYLYTKDLSTSQTTPSNTVHHEQTTVITGFKVNIPTDGQYKLYIKQSDGLGNTKVTASNLIQVDTTVPEFTYTIDPAGLVSFTATDPLSGIQSIILPSGASSSPATLGSKTHSGTYMLPKEGRYPFEVIDLAGNRKTFTVVFEKDYVKPTATHTLSPTGWTNQSVTIQLSAQDASGIQSILLPNNQTVTDQSSVSYTVSESGTYPFLITDRANNSLSYLVTVSNIDKENPSASLSPSTTEWTNQPIQVQVAASDRHSGIVSTSYQRQGGSWIAIAANGRFTHTEEGTFNYRVKATDEAGNTYTSSYTTLKVDLTEPTASHSLSTTAVTNQPVTITVNGTDALSQVKEIQLPDGLKTKGAQASYTVQQNGTYTFRVIDYAGNVLTYPVTITNIDNGAPELTLTVPNAESWSQSKTIQVSAKDSQGISWIKLPNGNYVYNSSTTYTVTENNYYYFEACDTVGNITRNYIYVGKIDRNAPEIELENYTHNFWTNQDVEVTIHGND